MERQLLSLPLADIEIGPRIGFYRPDHAAGLAVTMEQLGQVSPIHVQRNGDGAAKPWTLVAGRHRIGAAQALGWTKIQAIEVADANTDVTALLELELSENLDHRSTRPLERSIFIAARARIEEARDYSGFEGESSQKRAARVRWDATVRGAVASDAHLSDVADTVSDAYGWVERTAASCGVSLRTLAYYRAIHRLIIAPFPELAEALNAHQLGESFSVMRRITVMFRHDGLRRKVIETIIANPEFDTLDKACVAAGVSGSKGARVSAADQPNSTFWRAWENMPIREQSAQAKQLASAIRKDHAVVMIAEFRKRGFCQ